MNIFALVGWWKLYNPASRCVYVFFSEGNSESIMASVVLSGIFGAAKMRESLERKVVCRLTLPVLPFSQCSELGKKKRKNKFKDKVPPGEGIKLFYFGAHLLCTCALKLLAKKTWSDVAIGSRLGFKSSFTTLIDGTFSFKSLNTGPLERGGDLTTSCGAHFWWPKLEREIFFKKSLNDIYR